MNYYNPYVYTIPTSVSPSKIGLFSRLFGNSGITIGKVLNGTQRILNFANQAIPLVKQVRPMIGNAKTMIKVMNEFKRTEGPKQNTATIENSKVENETINIEKDNNYVESDSGPTFFI